MASEGLCEDCKFWIESGGTDAGLVGECHRNAPVPAINENPVDSKFHYALWPVTAEKQWCGDFEKRPMATKELMQKMAMIEQMESQRKKKTAG